MQRLANEMKILIADDSTAMRLCIKQALLHVDETLECSNGREAVRLSALERPDWVLMDIEMPELDGLSAAREIKAKWPEARILFVTAHDERRFRAAASQLGARGYVLKEHLDEINKIVGSPSPTQ